MEDAVGEQAAKGRCDGLGSIEEGQAASELASAVEADTDVR